MAAKVIDEFQENITPIEDVNISEFDIDLDGFLSLVSEPLDQENIIMMSDNYKDGSSKVNESKTESKINILKVDILKPPQY